MKNQRDTIKKMVSYINNPDEQGGLWLPLIQRKFVWDTEQITSLFDSVMRDYPISNMLIWKTKDKMRTRKFFDEYREDLKVKDFFRPQDDKKKMLVLDGQQRLQSFFISLKGSYEGKELHFNVLSGNKSDSEVLEDNIKYQFKFLKTGKVEPNWVRFKDIIYSDLQYNQLADKIIELFKGTVLSEDQKNLIHDNVARVVRQFKDLEVIAYHEIDSIDDQALYTKDDVVEIFIRANSGGTILSKSDLLFSLLESGWDFAEEKVQELKDNLDTNDFDFKRDFILKASLCLTGLGAKYEVEKFRDKNNLKKIEDNWERISDAIKDVKDFVYGKTYIKSGKALTSYLALIPLIFFRYNYEDSWKKGVANLDKWLVRVLLTGAFNGNPDSLIDQCDRDITEKKTFDIASINQIIKNSGRNLDVTEKVILSAYYGSGNLSLLFNLWYNQFGINFTPSFEGNYPQIDHIFPQSLLMSVKFINPITQRPNMIYQVSERDQIANCMLLTREENGPGGKGDTPPERWFEDKDDKYLEIHLIPKDKELWKLDNYEKFIEERKKLLVTNMLPLING